MVIVAAIQHHQEDNRTLSASRVASSRYSSGQDRDRGSKQKSVDARSIISLSRDAQDVIDGRRQEREDDKQCCCNDKQTAATAAIMTDNAATTDVTTTICHGDLHHARTT